jgi:Bacterial dnaA protein helix-turn-helix
MITAQQDTATERALALSAHERHKAFQRAIAQKAAALRPAPAKAPRATRPAPVVQREARTAGTPILVWPVIPPQPAYEPSHQVKIATIQRHVCNYFHIQRNDLVSSSRVKQFVHARWAGMYLARQLTGKSFAMIGREFGAADHTAALHGIRQTARLMLVDDSLAFEIAQLFELITGVQQ